MTRTKALGSGRKPKYRKELCDLLIGHMENGYSFDSFGAIAGVGRQSLYNWCELYPEFAEAKDHGSLLRLYNYETTMSDLANGRIQGSAPAMQFRFKNINVKSGSAWKDTPVEDSPKVNQGIQITFSRASDVTLSEVLDD